MPRKGYSVITIREKDYNALKMYLDLNKEELAKIGVVSIGGVVAHLLDKVEGKEPKARLEHFNTYEDHITIRDLQLSKFVDVYVRDRKLYCSECNSDSCLHVGFAWSIPKVIKILSR